MNLFSLLEQQETLWVVLYLLVAFLLGLLLGYVIWGIKIARLNKSIRSKDERVRMLEEQLKEAQEIHDIHDADMKRVGLELRNSQIKSNRLDAEKSQLQKTITHLQDQEATHKADLDELNLQLDAMSVKYESVNKELKQISAEAASYSSSNNDGNNADDLMARIDMLTQQNKELVNTRAKEKETYINQVRELRMTLSELQTVNYNTTEQLNLRARQVDDLKAELVKLRNTNVGSDSGDGAYGSGASQDDVDELLAKNNSLVLRIADLEKRNQALSTSGGETAALSLQVQSLQEALEAATDNLAMMEGEKSQLQQELEELSVKLAQLEDEKLQLEADFAQHMETKMMSARSVASNQSETDVQLEELEQHLQIIQKQKANQVKLARVEKEGLLRQLNAKEKALQAALAELVAAQHTNENEAYKLQLVQLKAALKRAEAEKQSEQDSFAAQVLEMQANHAELMELEQHKLDAFITEQADLNARISELETANYQVETDAMEQLTSMDYKMMLVNDQLSRTRDENMNLYVQINELKARIETLQQQGATVAATGTVSSITENQALSAAKKAVIDLIGNVIPKAGIADKDDLKVINGIGAFIEEKLNGLGIYTYEQISYFDEDAIEKVTEAIQFFPGRIQRDGWINQAKELIGKKSNSDAITSAKIAIQNAMGNSITVATPDEKDDLKVIKGIGSFIEQQLNELGIYTYEQISQLDAELIARITTAIEFLPGRIERDDWVGQAQNILNR